MMEHHKYRIAMAVRIKLSRLIPRRQALYNMNIQMFMYVLRDIADRMHDNGLKKRTVS
jgi:hypothetical protein